MALVTVFAACVAEPAEDASVLPTETVAARTDSFTSLGTERVIPVRIVQMANDCNSPAPIDGCPAGVAHPDQHTCSTCSNGDSDCGPDTASYSQITDAIARANSGLKSLGVQVYVRSIEKYKMPLFVETLHRDVATFIPWTDPLLGEQLKRPYPALTDNSFNMGANPDSLKERNWLHAAQLRAGDPREIVMWVAECSHGGDGRRPWEGGSSFTADREFFISIRALAHEFAHVVGLEHTMDPQDARNPEKVADLGANDLSDYWDLVYGPNGPQNQYFASRSEAEAWVDAGHTLVPRHYYISNPPPDPADTNCWASVSTCNLYCYLNGVLRQTGDPGMEGLGFTFPGDQRGFNGMMYIDGYDGDLWAACPFTTFSESQAEQAKRTLRSDIRVDSPVEIVAPYAAGYTAKRNRLGDYRALSGFDKVDFNNDGLRDFAVWQPTDTPTAGSPGTFHVYMPGILGAVRFDKQFGIRGDVPVLADYDGDGRTDLAVVRSGGYAFPMPYSTGLDWVWCKSQGRPTNDPDCASPGHETWGNRGDVPLPGLDFDGNPATPELAVYRRGSGFSDYVDWKVVGQATTGTITVPAFQTSVVQMHGFYDGDNKTDVVLYNPVGGSFLMLLSTKVPAWDPAQVVTRTFNSALIANAIEASDAGANAPAVRHGAVALPAEKNGKRVLRVWDAYTGTWYTMWDPVTSSTVQACTHGSPRDIPLAGPIDRNQDGKTDMVLYRPTGTGPMISIKESGTSCISLTYEFSVPGATPRSNVAAVRDLNWDGRGDFVVIVPETFAWRRFMSSGTSFFEAGSVALGELGGMAL